jgi:hypothetical protein
VARKANTAQRVTFSAVLAADGTVTTNYTGLDSDTEKGAAAAVGIAALSLLLLSAVGRRPPCGLQQPALVGRRRL